MKPIVIRLIPFSLFILLAFFLWRGLSLDPRHLPTVYLNKPLPVFSLQNLEGKPDSLTNKSLKGHVSLLNVFASWCEACAEEHMLLLALSKQGVPIYGINYKDDVQDALGYLKRFGNPYRTVGVDIYGKTAIDLGVYGAPETFVIDRNGQVRYRHVGIVTAAIWQDKIAPMISRLSQ